MNYTIKVKNEKAYAEVITESIVTKTIEQLEPELANVIAEIAVLEERKALIEGMIKDIKAYK